MLPTFLKPARPSLPCSWNTLRHSMSSRPSHYLSNWRRASAWKLVWDFSQRTTINIDSLHLAIKKKKKLLHFLHFIHQSDQWKLKSSQFGESRKIYNSIGENLANLANKSTRWENLPYYYLFLPENASRLRSDLLTKNLLFGIQKPHRVVFIWCCQKSEWTATHRIWWIFWSVLVRRVKKREIVKSRAKQWLK